MRRGAGSSSSTSRSRSPRPRSSPTPCRSATTRGKRARVDVVGGVLCALGLAGPVFALIEAPRRGFERPADPRRRSSAGSRCSAAFVLWERRAPQPDAAAAPLPAAQLLVREPRDADRLRRALDADVLPRALPAADRRLLGRSESGLALVPITVVMFVLSPRVGRLSMRLRPAPLHGRRAADRRSRRSCAMLRLGHELLLLDASCSRRCSSSRSASR